MPEADAPLATVPRSSSSMAPAGMSSELSPWSLSAIRTLDSVKGRLLIMSIWIEPSLTVSERTPTSTGNTSSTSKPPPGISGTVAPVSKS